jgi:hypothetical protein
MHLFLEKEGAITIIKIRVVSSFIVVISLGTIILNVEGKLHQGYMNKSTI